MLVIVEIFSLFCFKIQTLIECFGACRARRVSEASGWRTHRIRTVQYSEGVLPSSGTMPANQHLFGSSFELRVVALCFVLVLQLKGLSYAHRRRMSSSLNHEVTRRETPNQFNDTRRFYQQRNLNASYRTHTTVTNLEAERKRQTISII